MSQQGWQIDRKVPLALVFMLLLQTGSAFWWASALNARVSALEDRVTATAPQGDRLTRVEVKLESALDGIAEGKAILRKEPTPAKGR